MARIKDGPYLDFLIVPSQIKNHGFQFQVSKSAGQLLEVNEEKKQDSTWLAKLYSESFFLLTFFLV